MNYDRLVFNDTDRETLANLAEASRAALHQLPELERFVEWLELFDAIQPTIEAESSDPDHLVFSPDGRMDKVFI